MVLPSTTGVPCSYVYGLYPCSYVYGLYCSTYLVVHTYLYIRFWYNSAPTCLCSYKHIKQMGFSITVLKYHTHIQNEKGKLRIVRDIARSPARSFDREVARAAALFDGAVGLVCQILRLSRLPT